MPQIYPFLNNHKILQEGFNYHHLTVEEPKKSFSNLPKVTYLANKKGRMLTWVSFTTKPTHFPLHFADLLELIS